MKTLILHSGHLGCTAKAAQILAELIENSTVIDTATSPKIDFDGYNNIIFGTNVRMFMLNKRFKKYAKKFLKKNNNKKVYAYIIGASTEGSDGYIAKAKDILGSNSFVVFGGGELNAEFAKGFAKKVIDSVKTELIAKGQPLPTIDNSALASIASAIKSV